MMLTNMVEETLILSPFSSEWEGFWQLIISSGSYLLTQSPLAWFYYCVYCTTSRLPSTRSGISLICELAAALKNKKEQKRSISIIFNCYYCYNLLASVYRYTYYSISMMPSLSSYHQQ